MGIRVFHPSTIPKINVDWLIFYETNPLTIIQSYLVGPVGEQSHFKTDPGDLLGPGSHRAA